MTMTPTTEGKQLAADLANALDVIGQQADWVSGQPWSVPVLETDAKNRVAYAVAVKLFAEALADLREIDRHLSSEISPAHDSAFNQAAAISAKWRVETDPLADALRALHEKTEGPSPDWDFAHEAEQLRAELSKRGYEIGGKS